MFFRVFNEQYLVYISENGTQESAGIYFEEETKYPGSVEEIIIKANPITASDHVTLLRLEFINAKVMSATPIAEVVIGTCDDSGSIFTETRVCADIASEEPFIKGDPLMSIVVKWGEGGQAIVKASNFYFDGSTLNEEQNVFSFDLSSTLPLTGDEENQELKNDESFTVFLILGVGSLLVIGFLIIYSKIHPTFKRVPVYYSFGLIIVLAAGAIYISSNLQNSTLTPIDNMALTTDPAFQLPPILRCQQKGCVDDNQCEIGAPDYVCNESKGLCERVCPVDEVQTGACQCSGDNEEVVCGKIDFNNDGKIDYLDLNSFNEVYNKVCIDDVEESQCGNKDYNQDRKIDYLDLLNYALNSFPESISCNQ